MAYKTEITGLQIKDGSVKKVDLNTTDAGEAVVTQLVAGNNIALSSTGVDEGTGDVTINLNTSITNIDSIKREDLGPVITFNSIDSSTHWTDRGNIIIKSGESTGRIIFNSVNSDRFEISTSGGAGTFRGIGNNNTIRGIDRVEIRGSMLEYNRVVTNTASATIIYYDTSFNMGIVIEFSVLGIQNNNAPETPKKYVYITGKYGWINPPTVGGVVQPVDIFVPLEKNVIQRNGANYDVELGLWEPGQLVSLRGTQVGSDDITWVVSWRAISGTSY